jgi:uncharacterized protein YcfJ
MKVLIMKTLLAVVMAGSALVTAQGQLFSPEAINGAVLGSLIGGFAGGSTGNCGYNFSGSGAAIGAGIGLAAGAVVSAVNRRNAESFQPTYYTPQPCPQPGYGYVYPAPVYAAPPPPPRPNYVLGGTVVGAASGALIGAGSNCQAGQGAAIGAASGLVVGGIAEYAVRKREKKYAAKTQPVTQPHSQTQPVQETQPQANGNFPKRGPSNTTYYWTTPPAKQYQIADAPRVPDAPTF